MTFTPKIQLMGLSQATYWFYNFDTNLWPEVDDDEPMQKQIQ